MLQNPDKLPTARFHPAPGGLLWIETTNRDERGDGEFGPEYVIWFLVDPKTDRMLINIDEPTPGKVCFAVGGESGLSRLFISLEGAKRFAEGWAIELLQQETQQRCARRKLRRVEKFSRL